MGTVGEQGDYFNLGRIRGRTVGRLISSAGVNPDIWVIYLALGGTRSRVMTTWDGEFDPAWPSNGKYPRVQFESKRLLQLVPLPVRR